MEKTLYLHIGHYKTGTTALQVFLLRNQQLLAQQGVEYAPLFLHHAKHSRFAFSVLREAGVTTLMHGYSDPTPAAEVWDQLYDHVRAAAQPKVVISSEEFMRIGEFDAAAEILAALAARRGDIRVRVVVYLRNPQAHLRSWYNQLVKMGVPVPHFNAAAEGVIEAIHTDYGRALRPWVQVFGAGQVTLRSYDAARSHGGDGGLPQDFLSVLGVVPDAGFMMPQKDVNPRLDDRVLELVRMMQNTGLPRPMADAIRDRFAAFLDREAALGSGSRAGFDALHARARQAFGALARLPDSNLDLAAFEASLPVPEASAQVEQTLLAGFLLSEIAGDRRRPPRVPVALLQRIEALEAVAGITPATVPPSAAPSAAKAAGKAAAKAPRA